MQLHCIGQGTSASDFDAVLVAELHSKVQIMLRFVRVPFVSYILSCIYCPNIFCPGIFCPSIFCPGIFCPNIVCPGIFCPNIFCHGIFCPSIFCPSIFYPVTASTRTALDGE